MVAMGHAYSTYCRQYTLALAALSRLRKESLCFRLAEEVCLLSIWILLMFEKLIHAAAAAAGQAFKQRVEYSLDSVLITPVQRVPRIELLTVQLLKVRNAFTLPFCASSPRLTRSAAHTCLAV
jgi:hypothetical protein